MMTTEGSTKIVNFMTSGEGFLVLGHDHTSHTCEDGTCLRGTLCEDSSRLHGTLCEDDTYLWGCIYNSKMHTFQHEAEIGEYCLLTIGKPYYERSRKKPEKLSIFQAQLV